jgi:hypothetical protein
MAGRRHRKTDPTLQAFGAALVLAAIVALAFLVDVGPV